MYHEINWIQWLGYAGSALIAFSMTMKSIVRLRIINLLGASTFALYGFLFDAYPVFILNSFIVIIDIYHLSRIYHKQDYFELFEPDSRSPFFRKFLQFHNKDIQQFFPDFKFIDSKDSKSIFVLRNMLPVGVFVCATKNDNKLEVLLDYVIPDYRDFKTAHSLYQNYNKIIDDVNLKYFVTQTTVPKHISYLQKLGFENAADLGQNWYIKEI